MNSTASIFTVEVMLRKQRAKLEPQVEALVRSIVRYNTG
jgi:hypothetical protein